MGYRASVYMKDAVGNYNVPVYNEYGKTKLLTAGFIVKLLRGITVNESTVITGIDLNKNYNRDPDRFATELLAMTCTGPVDVRITDTNNDPANPRYQIVVKDSAGNQHKYKIPRDTTTMSAVLLGDWLNHVDETGPEVPVALNLCGLHQFLNEDVAIRGGF